MSYSENDHVLQLIVDTVVGQGENKYVSGCTKLKAYFEKPSAAAAQNGGRTSNPFLFLFVKIKLN